MVYPLYAKCGFQRQGLSIYDRKSADLDTSAKAVGPSRWLCLKKVILLGPWLNATDQVTVFGRRPGQAVHFFPVNWACSIGKTFGTFSP